MRFINGLQYRAAAIAGMTTQFAWGGLSILAYKAFYETNPSAFPMEFSHLATYLWFQQAFLALFMVWFFENDIFASIKSGGIAYELSKPLNLYTMWFVKTAAGRLSKAVLRCGPVLCIAALLPRPYGLVLPASGLSFILFLITMVFTLSVVTAFCMLVYISAFYTIDSLGVRIVSSSLVEFLAGAIIPIPFFPDKIREILELLPFASMQNIPLRIYSGDLSGKIMYQMIGMQIFWLVVLIFLGHVWMKNSVKKIIVQGG